MTVKPHVTVDGKENEREREKDKGKALTQTSSDFHPQLLYISVLTLVISFLAFSTSFLPLCLILPFTYLTFPSLPVSQTFQIYLPLFQAIL